MKDFLRTKGFKMTQQREIIFRSFFEVGNHVTVDELYDRVRASDNSIGYSTVWRNLKLICKVGLAEEVNLGDGVTRYDRVTPAPHGHLFCTECKKLIEFDAQDIVSSLSGVVKKNKFKAEGYKIEVQGKCKACSKRLSKEPRSARAH